MKMNEIKKKIIHERVLAFVFEDAYKSKKQLNEEDIAKAHSITDFFVKTYGEWVLDAVLNWRKVKCINTLKAACLELEARILKKKQSTKS